MRSFLMSPAQSHQEVLAQLELVCLKLKEFSTVENRLLSSAISAMPRTPVPSIPLLYSGQIDMSQLRKDQFGAEFLEFPLNSGPPGTKLEIEFSQAMETFIRPNSVVTTKQVWSFSDSMDIAMSYQNGIILIAEPSEDSQVWEGACYVTPLSIDSEKVEWLFPPRTSFLVLSAEQREVHGKSVFVIKLKLCSPSIHVSANGQPDDMQTALPVVDVSTRPGDESWFGCCCA